MTNSFTCYTSSQGDFKILLSLNGTFGSLNWEKYICNASCQCHSAVDTVRRPEPEASVSAETTIKDVLFAMKKIRIQVFIVYRTVLFDTHRDETIMFLPPTLF